MKLFAASVLAVVVVTDAIPDIEQRFARTNGDTKRDIGISGGKSYPPGIATPSWSAMRNGVPIDFWIGALVSYEICTKNQPPLE